MTNRKSIFREIKIDCSDLVMTDRDDHCVDLEDNCEEHNCPKIKKALGIREREEAHRKREEAQCPTCGSIVAPHEITPEPHQFIQGMILGALGAISCVGSMYLYFKVFGLPPALKLHILNYWI